MMKSMVSCNSSICSQYRNKTIFLHFSFVGLGFANFMASCMVGLYYNMIIAWTIYYMFASFTSKLPWEDCGQDFNSDFCFSITDYANCSKWRNETGDAYVYHKGV